MDRLLEFVERVLGAVELLSDCSWGHRLSSVLRLRDASGMVWFVKRHGDSARYRREVAAYRDWAPALGDAAPALRAYDDTLGAVILSAVPGEAAPWPEAVSGDVHAAEQAVQRAAGQALRLLHGAGPARPWPGFAAAKLAEFDQLRPAAAELLRARELDAVRAQVAALAGLPDPGRVPCHHDYTPRNWLVEDDGTLHVVDFEWCDLDAPVADLARLHLGSWAGRPDLREAFLDGYGRGLTPADRATLHGCAALTATWLLVKARESRQPSFEEANRAALLRLIGGA